MSTPISKALTGAALFALAACDTGGVARNAPVGVTLPDGLVIAGARGWCVDRATTQTRGEAVVVIFGSCRALTRDASEPRPSVPGIVTVSVENTGTGVPAAEAVVAFLESDAGRAALSRDGTAASVEILETDIRRDAVVLHAIDRSGLPRQAAEEYWRALFEIDGRVVTVSLVALANASRNDGDWRAALDAQISRLKSANAS